MTKTEAPAGSDAPQTELSLDERLRFFWARYGNLIYVVCGLIAAAILAKGAMDYFAEQKELTIEKEFAACTTPEAYKTFAAAHPDHPLAALVDLRVADDSYAGGKFAEAATGYERAVAKLPAGPFQARARLGLAISQAQAGGGGSDAVTGLRQLLNDDTQLKAIRCEAGYHLAVYAVAAGRSGEVQKLAEQLMQIDPSSPFAERTFQLRAEIPTSAIAMPSIPAISLPVSR